MRLEKKTTAILLITIIILVMFGALHAYSYISTCLTAKKGIKITPVADCLGNKPLYYINRSIRVGLNISNPFNPFSEWKSPYREFMVTGEWNYDPWKLPYCKLRAREDWLNCDFYIRESNSHPWLYIGKIIREEPKGQLQTFPLCNRILNFYVMTDGDLPASILSLFIDNPQVFVKISGKAVFQVFVSLIPSSIPITPASTLWDIGYYISIDIPVYIEELYTFPEGGPVANVTIGVQTP